MKKLLLTALISAFILASCGKKEEPEPQQQPQEQQQQPQTQQQTQQPTTSADDPTKKEEEKKKEGEKLKAEEKKKKEEEEKKKKEEQKEMEKVKKEDELTSADINFAPIFAKRCAKCHGKDGTGKLEGVPNLTLPKTKNKSEKQLISIITNGVKAETEEGEDMPRWKGKLTEEEIKAAAKYVKGL